MPERQRDFLSDLFQAVAGRSRKLFGLADGNATSLSPNALAEALLSTRGEASGVALARALLERWTTLDEAGRHSWFHMLARELGPDSGELAQAVAAWTDNPSAENAGRLHLAAEPRRQELFRRMNLAPGGTATLVKMREMLLDDIKSHPELAPVDSDFEHLFASWFNRGFLLMKRIGWSSPADVLEKIIRYEAVHEIRDWNDLKGRLKPDDRRCFGFFHPQMPDEPLVFVEVALTRGTPAEIAGLIDDGRTPIAENEADTAVFYSISNTQPGLRGVSFGNFLIKQVVEELHRELPGLKSFMTLSPVPGFAAWLAAQREQLDGGKTTAEFFDALSDPAWCADAERRAAVQPALLQAAAIYLIGAKADTGKPADSVARFHLNNGAALERINFRGDTSLKGLRQSHGIMVNYVYDLQAIERHHEAYANAGKVSASPAVRRLLAADSANPLSRSLQALLPSRTVLKDAGR